MQSNIQMTDPETTFPLHEPTQGAKEIEEFIYLISHDVRASVRALLELPQWITEDLEEAGVRVEGSVAASIQMMNRHTGRLDRMLVDLLAFSRVGRMQNMRQNDFEVALDTVLDEMKLPSGFSVTRDFGCREVAMGERDVLTLLDALVQNGVKHHDRPSGRIHVSSRVEGSETVLSVSDDGPGIPLEFHEKVFGAMQTLQPRDEVEGSGMGLATTRKIAATYGGTAALKAAIFGRGTTIEVRMQSLGSPIL